MRSWKSRAGEMVRPYSLLLWAIRAAGSFASSSNGDATLVIGVAVWLSAMPQNPFGESDRSVTPGVLARAPSSDVPDRPTIRDDPDFFGRGLGD